MAKWQKELRDQTLHIVMVAPLLFVVFFPGQIWPETLCALWFMFWREDAQHRKSEGWAWVWGGYWRWIDIAFGTLGGFIVGVIGRWA